MPVGIASTNPHIKTLPKESRLGSLIVFRPEIFQSIHSEKFINKNSTSHISHNIFHIRHWIPIFPGRDSSPGFRRLRLRSAGAAAEGRTAAGGQEVLGEGHGRQTAEDVWPWQPKEKGRFSCADYIILMFVKI